MAASSRARNGMDNVNPVITAQVLYKSAAKRARGADDSYIEAFAKRLQIGHAPTCSTSAGASSTAPR